MSTYDGKLRLSKKSWYDEIHLNYELTEEINLVRLYRVQADLDSFNLTEDPSRFGCC